MVEPLTAQECEILIDAVDEWQDVELKIAGAIEASQPNRSRQMVSRVEVGILLKARLIQMRDDALAATATSEAVSREQQ